MAGGEVSRFRSTVTSVRVLFLAVQHSHTLPKKGGPLRASAVSSNEPEGPSPLSTYRSSGVATRKWSQPFVRLSRCRDSGSSPRARPVARRFQVAGALCESPRFEQEEK